MRLLLSFLAAPSRPARFAFPVDIPRRSDFFRSRDSTTLRQPQSVLRDLLFFFLGDAVPMSRDVGVSEEGPDFFD